MHSKKIHQFVQRFCEGKIISFNKLSKNQALSYYVVNLPLKKLIVIVYESPNVDIDFLNQTNQYFISLGFPFPKLLATKKFERQTVAITSYCEGSPTRNWGLDEYREVGFMLGAIHKSSTNFTYENDSLPLSDEVAQNFETIKSNLPKELFGLEKKIDQMKTRMPNNLPNGFVHGDLWEKNVIFNNGKITGISGIFNFRYDVLLLDLTRVIKNFIFIKDTSLLDHYLASYEIINPLSIEERENLPLFTELVLAKTILEHIDRAEKDQAHKQFHLKSAALNYIKLQETKTFFDKNTSYSKIHQHPQNAKVFS